MRNKRKVTKKQLQRVGGILSHCSKVIKGGRTFSCHIFNLLGSLKEPHHRVLLSAGVREDFAWWLQFSKTLNGQATIISPNTQSWSIYSDASTWGNGALFGTDWIVGNFGMPKTPYKIIGL